ncbi:MAG: DUF1573 domain-containing protein [Taibaiella sp.]|nr:DUF1573 domain-containing protein [Taibaiella sp.]
MKKLFITLLCLSVGVIGANAQAPAMAPKDANAPKFKFKEESWDFGTVKEGPQAIHNFEFKNTGKEPLIIQNASASCGCTTPDWPKEPILPGKSGKISVTYNTQGRVGPFTKDIYIQSNAQMDAGDRFQLHIKGTVVAAPQEQPKQ